MENQVVLNHCYLGRHHTYYFRFKTPAKLRQCLPDLQKEFRKSLKTGYLLEAQRKANLLHHQTHQLCELAHKTIHKNMLQYNIDELTVIYQ